MDILIQEIDRLTTTHIAENQSKNLKNLKETLKPNEAIIILDSAENYNFIVQDAFKRFHWNNSQATLHPYVVYLEEMRGKYTSTAYNKPN